MPAEAVSLDIISVLTNGGLQAALAFLLMFFINAYVSEVNAHKKTIKELTDDHAETLKEIANVRQKRDEVQAVVEASRNLKTGTGL